MSMSALPAWSDTSEPETPADTTERQGGNPWLMLLPLGAAAVSAAVLLRKPALRKAATEVTRDPEVREVIKDAGDRVYRVVTTSWRRHGGPAGVAETFLR